MFFTIKRFKRAPLPAVAVLLFSAVISVIICALHASNEAEMSNYEEVYRTVPVEVSVTGLTGTKSNDLEAPEWVLDIFTGEKNLPVLLDGYVKDIQVMSSHIAYSVNGTDSGVILHGITSRSCDQLLRPENGCDILWFEGYDETVFGGEEMLCIIPEGKSALDNGNGEVVLNFKYTVSQTEINEFQCTLKIVGTYIGGDKSSIYCPFSVVDRIYGALSEGLVIDTLSATLADNERLQEFRNIMKYWFLEPTPLGQQVYWGRMGYSYYPYALDIDDSILQKTADILQNSIRINRICTAIIFVISAVAGFLIGFLMIRNRKRDIALMRILGKSNVAVYWNFVLEQMSCIILGIIAGGAYNLWRPINRIAIFAMIYYIGLSAALAIFLRKTLLTTIKEDE